MKKVKQIRVEFTLNLTAEMQKYYQVWPEIFRDAIAQDIQEGAEDAPVTGFKFTDVE